MTVTPDSQLSVSAVLPLLLTFTSNNWYNPQTVTVTAEDDSVYEGDHTGTIINTASSTDPNYDNYELPSVTANIADNDPTP